MSHLPHLHGSLAAAIRRLGSGTLLSRITGMGREMTLAYAFGTSRAIALFMVAYRLAHLLRRILGEQGLHSGFIPLLEENRQRGGAEAFYLRTRGVFVWLLLSLVAIGGIGLTAILTTFNLGDESFEVIRLTRLMLPSLFFICLCGLDSAYANCHGQFFRSSFAPVYFNLISIVSVVIASKWLGGYAIDGLAVGVIIASCVQWLAIRPRHIHCHFQETSHHVDIKRLFKAMCMGTIGIAATQINSALDALFACVVDASGPAFLWYAFRLVQFPIALIGVSLAGALLPKMSRAVSLGNLQEVDQLFTSALNIALRGGLIATFLCFLIGGEGVMVIYGHGAFGEDSFQGTLLALWAYGVGILPSVVLSLIIPLYHAHKHYVIPVRAVWVSVACNCLLNAFATFFLQWGAWSVALATSVSTGINVLILLKGLEGEFSEILCWRRVLARVQWTKLAVELLCTLGVIPVALWLTNWHQLTIGKAILGEGLPLVPDRMDQLLTLIIVCAAYAFGLGLAYVVNQVLFPRSGESTENLPSFPNEVGNKFYQ